MIASVMHWQFAWPWLLAALPLPWLAVRWLPPAPSALDSALRVPFAADVDALGSASGRTRQARFNPLWWLIWVLLCLAAARPQELGPAQQPPAQGRDLLLAVDLSGSMAAEDMRLGGRSVDRLTAVKAVLADFLDRRVGDRVGLLLFGERAYAVTPLTLDRNSVRQQLLDSVVGLAGQETAIGDAIALAVKRLGEPAENAGNTGDRVVILLTDGVNTAGTINPDKATQLAESAAVRVHTIGFGGSGEENFFGIRMQRPAQIDEATLRRMAERTGGRYFRARDTQELAGIYAELDRIEPTARPGDVVQPRVERYAWPLALALLFAALALLRQLWPGRGARMGLSGVEFAWLRPLWLLALLLLPAIWWLWRRRHGRESVWQRAIDPHLLPHLLQHVEVRGAWSAIGLWLVAAILAIVALAGPSLRQQPAPLWQMESPLVIALDLSAAMRAADLPPSRLVQARAKLKQLLEQRRSGQVGLLVYAGDAFTVAPITRDARTVIALLESLSPDIMPVQGQRADRAIEHALRMLRDNGADSGEILLISDRADLVAERAAARARDAGVVVSVLGVGTLAGAPLSGAGGFITGPDGQALLARLDPASLGALAVAGGGKYVALSVDDSDLATLGVLNPLGKATSASAGPGRVGEDAGVIRSDDGYWLLLLLLPLVLLGFRRGWLALLPLVLAIGAGMPPSPAFAAAEGEQAPAAAGFSWDTLWQRADQRAWAALQQGEHQRARELAPDPDLQGAAAYRGDDFEAAASTWASQDSADAHYNRGNALARAGKLEDALKAYDEALARSPGMPDAVANRQAVEDALKQQQAQDQQDQQDKQDQQDQQDSQDSQDSQEQKDGQGEQGEQQDSQQSDQGQQDSAEQQKSGEDSGEQKPGSDGEAQGDPQQQSDEASDSPSKEQPGDQDGDGKPDQQSAEDAPPQPEQAADAAEREAAEAAAKQAMQQALDAQQDGAPEAPQQTAPMTPEERAQAEQRQATEQWLRRVPDDPGALLKRKFELEYRRRMAEGDPQ